MTRPTWRFYTLFKNIPYTDEEWERSNAERHSQKSSLSQAYLDKHPEYFLELKQRPTHSFRHGPTVFSHEEARKVCETAFYKNKAQRVEYSVWNHLNEVEQWKFERPSPQIEPIWFKVK